MRMRVAVALGAMSMVSGCVAPLLLQGAISGGAVAGGMGVSKNMLNRKERQIGSAYAIDQHLRGDAVKISNLKRTDEVETWVADTPKGRYACSVPRGQTNVSCTKV